MTAQLMRYLGTVGYGHYSLALGFAPPFALISDLIAAQVVIREVAARPEATRRIVVTAMVLRGLFAVAALLLSSLAAWGWGYAPAVRLAIVVYSLTLLLAPCDVLSAVLQARLRLRLLSAIGIAATGVNLVLILLAVHARVPLPWVVAAAAAPAFVRAMATAWVSLRSGSRLPAPGSWLKGRSWLLAPGSWRSGSGPGARSQEPGAAFDSNLARRLLDGSWPLALAMLLNMVPASLPTFCLGALPNGEALGIFAAASRVPTMLGMIPNAAMVALFPLMARAHHCSVHAAAGILARAQTAMLALALPLAIGAVVLAEDGMRFLGGDAYTPAVPGLRMMAVSLVFLYPGIAAGHMLIASGRERTSMAITAVGALSAMISAPWLCERYGADGAAAGVASLHAGIALTSIIAAARALRLPPGRILSPELRRIVGCALVMTGVVLLLRRLGLFAAIGGGAVAYALCFWCAGLLRVVFQFPSMEEVGTDETGRLLRRGDGATGRRGETAQETGRRGDPAFARQEPGARSQEPGARSRERSERRQEPGAWSRLQAKRLQAAVATRLAEFVWRCCYLWCRRRAVRLGSPHQALDPASVASILVLDRDYIGDVVCITPALAALRRRFLRAKITLAVAPNVAPLFEGHPDVDRVETVEEARGPIDAVRLLLHLRRLSPQSIVIGLGTVPANAWLGQLAGVLCDGRVRLGEAHGRYPDLLTHSLARSPEPCHWAQIHLNLLRLLGVEDGLGPTRLVTTGAARAAVARFLEHAVLPSGGTGSQLPAPGSRLPAPGTRHPALGTRHPALGTRRRRGEVGALPRPWIGIHPGGRIYQIPDAGHPEGIARLSRRWPAERFRELARSLIECCGGTVFLTGGSDETPTSALVAEGCPAGCVDVTGRLTLSETAALMAQCDVFITSDTGPMHMAFALDVPTVAIFGPTDPRRVGPLGEEARLRHRILTPHVACAPCGGEALIPCSHPDGQVCLTEISVERVSGAVQELLQPRVSSPCGRRQIRTSRGKGRERKR
jgi:ADP-heptose:LPS heptosyltransferase/O-antigen/teichoic acid export membrane protein